MYVCIWIHVCVFMSEGDSLTFVGCLQVHLYDVSNPLDPTLCAMAHGSSRLTGMYLCMYVRVCVCAFVCVCCCCLTLGRKTVNYTEIAPKPSKNNPKHSPIIRTSRTLA